MKIVSIVVETPAIPDAPEVGTLRATYSPPFSPEIVKLLQEQVEADEHHKAAKEGFEG